MNRGKLCLSTRLAYIGLGLALLSPLETKAADYQYQFNTVFSYSGSLPSPTGPPPWLTAELKDVTPGKVDLILTTSGLQGSEFIGSFYLNLDPHLSPTSLTFTKLGKTGSFTDPTIGLGENSYKADGDGYYDINLNFATGHGATFTFGDSITYQITGSSLDANSFDFTSQMGGGAGTWLAAAHVQSIGSDGSSSAWAAPNALVPVPEPTSTTLLLLGTALWFGRRITLPRRR